jgi:hypothetical protein
MLLHSFSNCGTPTSVYWLAALIQEIRNIREGQKFQILHKTQAKYICQYAALLATDTYIYNFFPLSATF